jgi:pimeloyl-ACP methyl ester carboxylesterase
MLGTKSPLLLVHGFTATARVWDPVVGLLEPHHQVLAPTLPGHLGGEPLAPGETLSIDWAVDALEAQLDAAGIQTAHVVGNSLGGWLALQLAARGRARSVVALSPAGGWVHGTAEGRRIARLFTRQYHASRIAGRHAESLGANAVTRQIALRDGVVHARRVPAADAAHMIEAAWKCEVTRDALKLLRSEGVGDLGPIDCPARIAWGEQDRVLRWPRCAERFRTMTPEAELLALPGCGHLSMWDEPELVARTILEVTAAGASLAAAA